MTEQHEQVWVDRVNHDMNEAVIDYMVNALKDLGIPRGTWTTDQLDNMIAMYNLRGNVISSLNQEIESLQKRLETLDLVLVEIANWPNRNEQPEVLAVKTLAASVVDPKKVKMFAPLFD